MAGKKILVDFEKKILVDLVEVQLRGLHRLSKELPIRYISIPLQICGREKCAFEEIKIHISTSLPKRE